MNDQDQGTPGTRLRRTDRCGAAGTPSRSQRTPEAPVGQASIQASTEMQGLQGRRILVTGGARGIGAAIVRAVAAAGASPAVLTRNNPGRSHQKNGVVAVYADLRDPERSATAVRQAARAVGGLDALVNNTGTFRLGRISDGVYSDWRDMIDTNILGFLAATKAALPFLAESPSGQIINVSSRNDRRVTGPEQGVYAATKHAVHAISSALHHELHDLGIRVTTISPGLVRTNLGSYITDPGIRAEAEAKQRAWGLDPSAVAAEVVHVLSTSSDVHLVEITLVSKRQPPG